MFSMAHIHLLVNHFPIIGSYFVAIMFFIALIFKNVFLQKVSLWFFAGCAIFTAIAFASGGGTKAAVQGLPQASTSMIAAHEQAANYGLGIMFIAGVLSLGGIILYSKKPTLPFYYRVSIVVVLLVGIAVLSYVGFLGGQIMHTEIRSFVPSLLL
jgi:hypothetical protein